MKYVYFFGAGKAEGDGTMKEILGGKGAGLAEMTRIGLPVPARLHHFHRMLRLLPEAQADLPEDPGGGSEKESGAPGKSHRKEAGRCERSAAGERALGVGAVDAGDDGNDLEPRAEQQVGRGPGRNSNNDRFAWDAYRRFVQMYSTVVIGLSKEELEEKLRAMKTRRGVKDDTQVPAEGWRELVGEYKEHFKKKTGKEFPEDPEEQLWGAIGAVFGSWMAEKAVTYRRVERITGLLGTAVNVVQMVFGNLGETSGTGVCFTRDPSTGGKTFYGDFLINAQGEDVVAGIPHADAPERNGQAHAEGVSAAGKSAEAAGKTLPRHAGHGVHGRRGHALHAADARRQAHAGGDVSDRGGHGQRRTDHQGRSDRPH